LLQHDFDREDIPKTALSAQNLSERLKQIETKRLWVIVDSCHAEGMARGNQSSWVRPDNALSFHRFSLLNCFLFYTIPS
jgi:hypothetical protein